MYIGTFISLHIVYYRLPFLSHFTALHSQRPDCSGGIFGTSPPDGGEGGPN